MHALLDEKTVISIYGFDGEWTDILNSNNERERVKTDRISFIDNTVDGVGIILCLALLIAAICAGIFVWQLCKYAV